MGTLTVSQQLTLLELARRIDPQGDLAKIAEILTQDNEIVEDAIFLEANDIFSHKITQRDSLPRGTARRLNAGVAVEASTTREVTDVIMMLEAYSECDKKLIDVAPNPKAARMQEAIAFIEGLGQTLATKLIYGNNALDPEDFTGLAPRLNSLTGTGTSRNMVIDGGASSNCTSIYVVQWGENKVHMIYPKNGEGTLGVSHRDLGEVTLEEYDSTGAATGRKYQGYRDHFKVECGLVVRNPRCIGRIANIATSGSSDTFDEDDLITLLNRLPNRGRGARIYCNETITTQMDIKAKDKTNVNYSPVDWGGIQVMTFRGIPVRKVDAILDTETAVS